MVFLESETFKGISSEKYNSFFDKRNGFSARWGMSFEEDPQWCAFGPELLDLEISTGSCSGACPWCCKSNQKESGKNMSLETFKAILSKMPETLTQIAFGITDADANSDFVSIMEHCRERGVIPNYTTNGFGLTPEVIVKTVELCGAVAVSLYSHNLVEAYTAVRRFLCLGMDQVNIHLLYHADNMDFCREALSPGLTKVCVMEGLNAVVLLAAKPVGRGEGLVSATQDQFEELMELAMAHDVPLGFDSCSAPRFERWLEGSDRDDKERLLMSCERCESFCFSLYCNVDGIVHPCSFAEETTKGMSLLENSFEDVWNSIQAKEWRKRLFANERRCPEFPVNGGDINV